MLLFALHSLCVSAEVRQPLLACRSVGHVLLRASEGNVLQWHSINLEGFLVCTRGFALSFCIYNSDCPSGTSQLDAAGSASALCLHWEPSKLTLLV